MPSDTWLKLHTSLLTSSKFVGLPSNDHRLAFVCLLLLAKKGLESAPERYILAHVFLGKRRWKIVQKDLIKSGLLSADGKVNGFEDSQLSASAWKMRRLRERNKSRDSYGHSGGHSDRECRMQSVSSPSEKKKIPSESCGATSEPVAPPAPILPLSPTYAMMPVKEGDEPITEADVAHWESLYGRIDVRQTLKKMVGYWAAKPRNQRKTRGGIRRSINSWLAKDDDKAPMPQREVTATSVDEGGWEY